MLTATCSGRSDGRLIAVEAEKASRKIPCHIVGNGRSVDHITGSLHGRLVGTGFAPGVQLLGNEEFSDGGIHRSEQGGDFGGVVHTI